MLLCSVDRWVIPSVVTSTATGKYTQTHTHTLLCKKTLPECWILKKPSLYTSHHFPSHCFFFLLTLPSSALFLHHFTSGFQVVGYHIVHCAIRSNFMEFRILSLDLLVFAVLAVCTFYLPDSDK